MRRLDIRYAGKERDLVWLPQAGKVGVARFRTCVEERHETSEREQP